MKYIINAWMDVLGNFREDKDKVVLYIWAYLYQWRHFRSFKIVHFFCFLKFIFPSKNPLTAIRTCNEKSFSSYFVLTLHGLIFDRSKLNRHWEHQLHGVEVKACKWFQSVFLLLGIIGITKKCLDILYLIMLKVNTKVNESYIPFDTSFLRGGQYLFNDNFGDTVCILDLFH